ncbi:MAG TPA: TIGR02680 family protein [Streptosporangiaceae bacterium]|nr:TIGR02680 family protein [Streptosporangiaceae bacterium]
MSPPRHPGPPRRFDDRWRLCRAGIVNVWFYLDNEFSLSGGRMILRGTNGSGKSRALEMLLPFLLDADRRRMDATGAARVSLDELMRTGAQGQSNRTGYLWLELTRPGEYLTVGALVRHSQSASTTKVWYFTTPLRVGEGLSLMSAAREPLSRDALTELIGAERITESAQAHRDHIRALVFGLHGDAGRDRYDGLLQLVHTLRAPDVGNRIDEGRLPQILLESLPPLQDEALSRAGEQLDGLTDTRLAQQRLEDSAREVDNFLGVYRRYAAETLRGRAEETLAAATTVTEARNRAAERAGELASLEKESVHREAAAQQLAEERSEIEAALQAIEKREIFKTADDLVQRDQKVAELARSADRALAEAGRGRDHHARAVQDAGRALSELRAATSEAATALAATRYALADAGLPAAGLPVEIRTVEHEPDAGSALLRVQRDGDPQPVARPAAARATVIPTDLDAAQDTARAAAASAAERLGLAQRRLQEARRLQQAEQQVLRMEAEAGQLRATAEEDAQAADDYAATRDAAAVALAEDWRAWCRDPQTTQLLGETGWATHPLLGPLLRDAGVLAGDDGTTLDELDELADVAARPPRAAVARARADLDRAAADDRDRGAELRAERADLAAERDPKPAEPPWLDAGRGGEPLWRCVDFADHLDDGQRAGLEGSLLAAGLLSAIIQPDGTVLAADGELLISPGTMRPERSLAGALHADPAASLPAATITSVIAAIGYNDPAAVTTVSADGHWRNGPLRGRHVAAKARHVGAAARAAHRLERIAQIEAELAAQAARAELREQRRAELDRTVAGLDALVRAAPRTSELFAARRVAAESATRARHTAARAKREAELAQKKRATWAGELTAHQATCAHLGLPSGTDALDGAAAAAGRARDSGTRLGRELSRVDDSVRRHQEQLRRVADAEAVRDDTELDAGETWSRWHAEASALAAQHEAIDLSIEQAQAELTQAREAEARATRDFNEASQAVIQLGPKLGAAREANRRAAEDVDGQLSRMVGMGHRFNRSIALPGLAAAATADRLTGIVQPDQLEQVTAAANAVLAKVTRVRQVPSVNSVLNAFRDFDREVSGQLDLRYWLDDEVLVVEVAGAGDERTLAGAARTLAARVQSGRAALTEREREVFTRFVLGGVAEELRRRVNQASQLVDAMNTSLKGIRTSNGIGVRLSWSLREEHAALGRILELVATSDAVRSEAQNAELTELLRTRVEVFHSADPSSGYAAHLAAAMDYRQWHEVNVTILGPDEGQQRRLSRRAKLSQGETRFVSYVTLFAAADGYLTSLGDDGRALRLILLDDAFAKVDEATVAELMGLLVTLDLDFVMTGHALWGCFPQVPRLDVYEVRRSNGSSAVTTHVHWDGHNRHLRSTA